VEFLRDVGAHFSVNRMLTAECYKNRLEKGLSFLEFNYMLMQSYDFLVLNQTYGCSLQVGGDDQWSNMLSGADLIRRKEQKPAFALTCQLLLNSQGQKMGKTVGGALWLDENRVSPYEFYQYWRNVDDADVERCLALLTFMPMEDVRRLGGYRDERINESKRILAYEITKTVHGEAAARQAMETAEALFAGKGTLDNMPTTTLTKDDLNENGRIVELMVRCGLTKSNGEGRRLITQGAVMINDELVTDTDARAQVNASGMIIIKKGKKGYHRFIVEG
jgi:tyrosyl-tRNA synthetase